MECEIVSQQTIKPSSPTPLHLKTYKTSLLDQLIPPSYVALIFHYQTQTHESPQTISQKLKHSLSQTLTRFYPFAGKLKDDLSAVDCTDEGAFYVEARVNSKLIEFLSEPDTKTLHCFLPVQPIWGDPLAHGRHVAIVQVTFFAGGGVAVGVCVLHRIADGACLISFARSWASTCCGSMEAISPSFTSSALFPHNEALTKALTSAPRSKLLKSGKSALRRFVFDQSSIATLRAKTHCGGAFTPRAPTRVEVVSGLIWRCAIAASKAMHGGGHCKASSAVLSHVVNIRKKAVPTFPTHSFGNFVWTATGHSPASAEFSKLVIEIRNATEKINGEFVKKLQGEEGFPRVCECIRESGEVFSEDESIFLSITSLCNSGVYEADFGWGKPGWVRMGISENEVFMNLVFLMDTRVGNGVEAWVLLSEEEMAMFERDPELLAVAAVEPSVMMMMMGLDCSSFSRL